ncbi:unnamed protein product [Paramecium primaurelia]|uniref:MORN repeat protein n=1 Tax=Paramecium primaurelia TaxID=5886 RepID=A0A8S1MJM2_PARPR|nr:unnamed protein product [Paramecium primaurelia]
MQITYVGEYINGKKCGLWDVFEQNIFTGGGLYDANGLKHRKWIDLSDNFKDYIHIVYIGEYINGKKCGMWETLFRYDKENNFEKIFSGQFNDQGQKNGKWIELSDNFDYTCQVIYQGKYQNGIQIDRWDSMYRLDDDRGFIYIGEGFFDEKGQKYGKWIELWDNFKDESQVIFKGEYNNNKKFGHWQTMFRYSCNNSFEIIGGGHYNNDGLKQGRWIDLSECFSLDHQVIRQGEYKFGKKCNCWVVMKREREKKNDVFQIMDSKNQQIYSDQNY